MTNIEIKRGYEVLPDNNVRFGIRIANTSDVVISDVEVILDYSESLFKLEGERVQKVGVIPPAGTRTAEYILKPLGCVHQVNIEALISYRDIKYARQRVDMQPKEVHCVCPFLKGKAMPRAEFLELSNSGHSTEMGLNFRGVSVERLASYLVQTCKSRHHKVDDYSVDGGRMLYLASESIGEKAYYLLTALIKEDGGLTQVMLRVASDKSHGLNGFLNETVAELRHVVSTVQSAQEIGIIKNEQVINIIDSVVQRSSFGGVGGSASVDIQDSVVQRSSFDEVGASINIQDSVVQRTEFNAGEDNKVEEERLRGEREKQRKQEEERKTKAKQEQLEREQEAARKENEQRKAREVLILKQRDEHQKPTQKSRKNVFMFAIVLGALLVGFMMFPPESSDIADVSSISIQPEAVPESIEPTSPRQSVVESDVSQIPAPSFDQKTRTNSIGMEFVLIPAGEFDMGSPSNESGRHSDSDEGPVHGVTISDEFYMSRYEITQEQWREVMGENPSWFKGDALPVETVSWDDVQEFIRKLNEKEGTDKYRLPSEAEWEYAARAGTTTRYSFGDSESKLGEYAWYDDNSGSKTHSVGQKKPNSWGLYDMHGNVWEWVQDKYHGNYDGAPSDGSVWKDGGSSPRIIRGGAWAYDALDCRSAFRVGVGPSTRSFYFGFRLLQEP